MSPDFDIFCVFFPYLEIEKKNRNSLKLGQNYAYRNPKLLQLLGDLVPQTPYRGFAPGPHWGTSVPQTPCTGRPPTFCTRFTPLPVVALTFDLSTQKTTRLVTGPRSVSTPSFGGPSLRCC